MITFFSKKTYLTDLIPSNYIDIHSHLIPGIDDGAKTIDDSINLINELNKIGFNQFITTPHIMPPVWNNNTSTIQKGEKVVQVALDRNNIPFKAAAEYMLDHQFLEMLKNEQLLTLKENYLLVEMSYLNPPINIQEIVYEIQIAGYTPILAHPERYLFLHQNFDFYTTLKKSGCLFQLNLLSVVGYYGLPVLKTAEKLLKQKMIDFVGSDLHHHKHLESFCKKVMIKEMAPLKEAIQQNQLFRFSV